MVGDKRQGYAILAAMARPVGRWSLAGIWVVEAHHPGTALQPRRGVDGGQGDPVRGGRLGAVRRPRRPARRPARSNSFHDSFTALGGGLAIFNMGLGEVAPGGVGSGLYGMLVLAIVTVFVAGLMVGRTPEYLRKKITAREIKLVSLYILTMPVLVLAGTGLAMALPDARGSRSSTPARTGCPRCSTRSCPAANNNGSAFAGLSANTGFYNTALGLAMLARPVPADRARARRWPARWPASSRSRRPPARCPPTARCSSGCSSASSSSSPA